MADRNSGVQQTAAAASSSSNYSATTATDARDEYQQHMDEQQHQHQITEAAIAAQLKVESLQFYQGCRVFIAKDGHPHVGARATVEQPLPDGSYSVVLNDVDDEQQHRATSEAPARFTLFGGDLRQDEDAAHDLSTVSRFDDNSFFRFPFPTGTPLAAAHMGETDDHMPSYAYPSCATGEQHDEDFGDDGFSGASDYECPDMDDQSIPSSNGISDDDDSRMSIATSSNNSDTMLHNDRNYAALTYSRTMMQMDDNQLIDLAFKFCRPGVRFVGDIIIPGVEDCHSVFRSQMRMRQKYTVYIIRRGYDELGKRILIGSHAAYTDEQSFAIEFEVKVCHESKVPCIHEHDESANPSSEKVCASEEETQDAKAAAPGSEQQQQTKQAPPKCCVKVVEMKYADLETSCIGVIDFERGRVEGLVFQSHEGEEGFFYNSEKATHTFDLLCECYDKEYISRSIRLQQAKQQRVVDFVKWFSKIKTRDVQGALDRVVWTSVFRDCLALSEEWCATIRRQAEMLNKVTFRNLTEREEILAQLSQRGVQRQQIHAKSDEFINALKVMGSAVIALHHLPAQEKNRIICDMFRLIQKEAFRLDSSFRRLDNALRYAESRLPQDLLQGWKSPGDGESNCGICMCTLEVDEEIVKLPCNHDFHSHCAKTWLHFNTTCPYCRSKIGPSAVDASLPDPLNLAKFRA